MQFPHEHLAEINNNLGNDLYIDLDFILWCISLNCMTLVLFYVIILFGIIICIWGAGGARHAPHHIISHPGGPVEPNRKCRALLRSLFALPHRLVAIVYRLDSPSSFGWPWGVVKVTLGTPTQGFTIWKVNHGKFSSTVFVHFLKSLVVTALIFNNYQNQG